MTPYYEDDLVQLWHGDCREVTAWLKADVLVTDPPYGMAYVSNRSKDGPSAAIVGDEDRELRDWVLQEWGDRPALVFGTWRLARPANTRHLVVWDKGDDPGTGDLSMPWGNSAEEVYVIGKGWTGKRGANVIRVKGYANTSPDRPSHPTPKPVGLLERLIEKCPPEWVIAEPFSGSGATLLAAKNLGRRAVGIELEERYCEMAAKRLAQDTLFGGVA